MINPDRVAFTIFGKDIYWYGILMAAGILIALWLALREGKRKNLSEDTIMDTALVVIPSGLLGARLYYVLFEWGYYIKHPLEILYVWEGGLAFYGCVLGGLLGLVLYARHKKLRTLRLFDCLAPGLVLAQAIGRWGNFFNQEAYGLPVLNGEMMWFPFAVRIDGLHYFNGELCSMPFHLATFFYESAWCLLVFLFLWSQRKKFKHDGDAVLWYVLLYGFERMLVEGLRADSLYLIAPGGWIREGIRVSQLLSFVAVAAVLAFMLVRRAREKRLGRLIWPAPLAEEAAEEGEQPLEENSEAVEFEAQEGDAPEAREEEPAAHEEDELG
ncbi:MAG: prolipoprotein diacylglyceryl transferase [Christensenellaceae bacterium]|jgi:phosphatidylglycerol:prolipoprotein diacylglycerol transferase|nr:prolipoprotein diacylglyceryl transferase [Christensenellaceae bacterium]